MRWPSSIETTATPIECGGPRSAWRERPTATIERRSGTARMAASRSLPISDHRPSGRPCAHRSRYTVSSSRWRPGCQTNDTAAGGQLDEYIVVLVAGGGTHCLGVRVGAHHGPRRVAGPHRASSWGRSATGRHDAIAVRCGTSLGCRLQGPYSPTALAVRGLPACRPCRWPALERPHKHKLPGTPSDVSLILPGPPGPPCPAGPFHTSASTAR